MSKSELKLSDPLGEWNRVVTFEQKAFFLNTHVSYVLAIVHLLCGQSVVVIGTVLFFHQFFIWSCLARACAVCVYNHNDALAKRENLMSIE